MSSACPARGRRRTRVSSPPRLERAHLVLVKEVLRGIAAAKEEERLADRRALFFKRRALEQEATERRDARARPDHDHRQVGVLGRMEGDRWLADERIHRGFGRLRGEIVGADPAELAPPAESRALQHPDGDAAYGGR